MKIDLTKYDRVDSLEDEEWDYTSNPVRWCGLFQHKKSGDYFQFWFHARPEWNERFQELVNDYEYSVGYLGQFTNSIIYHSAGISFPRGFEELCEEAGFDINNVDLEKEPSTFRKVRKGVDTYLR